MQSPESNAAQQEPEFAMILRSMERNREDVQQAFTELLQGGFYEMDLLSVGVIKKFFSMESGFLRMIEDRNSQCAGAILRMHLDATLRYSAAWMVSNYNDFARAVRRGERIDRLVDRENNRLRDAYLVEARAKDHPWIKPVYENLCARVHFSAVSIWTAVSGIEESSRQVSFEVGGADDVLPPSSWLEMLACFRAITEILLHYINGWASTKKAGREV